MSRQRVPQDQPAAEYADHRDFYTSYTSPRSGANTSPGVTRQSSLPVIARYPPPPSLPRIAASGSKQDRGGDQSPSRRSPRYVTSPSRNTPSQQSAPRHRSNLYGTSRVSQQTNLQDLVSRFNQDAANGEKPPVPQTSRDRSRRADGGRTPVTRSPVKQNRGRSTAQLRKASPRYSTSEAGTDQDGHTTPEGLSSPASVSSAGSKRRIHQPLFGELLADVNGRPNVAGFGIPAERNPETKRSHEQISGTRGRRYSDADSPSHYFAEPEDNVKYSRHSRSRSDHSFMTREAKSRHTESPIAALENGIGSSLRTGAASPPKNHMLTSRAALSPSSEDDWSQGTTTPISKYSRSTERLTGIPGPTGHRESSVARSRPSERIYQPHVSTVASPSSRSPGSNRQRQSVSTATTAASRARISERYNKPERSLTEDFAQARPRKKIPELGQTEFAVRRARIERAMSVHLEESPLQDKVSSRASSIKRRSSIASNADASVVIPEDETRLTTLSTLDSVLENPKSPLYIPNGTGTTISGNQSTVDTDFEEDLSPDLLVRMGPLLKERNEGVDISEDSIQSTPIEYRTKHVAIEDSNLFTHVLKLREGTSPATTATSPASPESVDAAISTEARERHVHSSSGIDARLHMGMDGAGTTVDGGSIAVIREHPQPESVRPLTPPAVLGVEADRKAADITPKPPGYFPSEDQDKSEGADFQETYMQRVIREYEETGKVNPALADKLQPNHNDRNRPEKGGSTIRLVLDDISIGGPRTPPATQLDQNLLLDSDLYTTSRRASYASNASASASHPRRSHGNETRAASKGRSNEPWKEISPISAADSPVDPRDRDAPKAVHSGPTATPIIVESDDQGPTPPPKPVGYSPRSSGRWSNSMSYLHIRPISPPENKGPASSSTSFSLPEIEVGESLDQGLKMSADASSMYSPDYMVPASKMSKSSLRKTAALQRDSPDMSIDHGVIPTRTTSINSNPAKYARHMMTPAQEESQHSGVNNFLPSQSMSSFSQMSDAAASTDLSSFETTNAPKEPTEMEKRLTKRKNIIKELVDTEYSYHQDMKIIEDIYKATVKNIISPEDKKTLFGNADQIESLSLEFYDSLRDAVAPFYLPPKSNRWQLHVASPDLSSDESARSSGRAVPEPEADGQTAVGAVFELFLPRFEQVYGTYLKNHDAANKRLATIQTDPTVMIWLKACHSNASDMTSAWDLDSLLVKPVQRILKYPLLLQQLLAVTPKDHADHDALSRAVTESTNISRRINDAKKRADLVESIVNRKQRKDSDVRTGLAKAFGLRGEKVKDRIGIKSDYQDPVYEQHSMKFGGHFVRLQIVLRDIQGSLNEIDRSVEKFNAFAQGLEQIIDVGYNVYPEIESKWRKFILAIRELSTAALPDHKAQVKKRVVDPIVAALKLHERPQDIMAKRKKRIVDYVRCQQLEKNGQKPDKKTLEGSEMYVALTDQLKIDLPRLYELTGTLVQRCLACHHQIQLAWLWTWEMKVRPVLDSFPESFDSIVPDFESDYDLAHAQVYSLGVCNGSLLADASSFMSPQLSFTEETQRPSRPSESRTQSISSEIVSPTLFPSDFIKNYSLFDSSNGGAPHGRARSASQVSAPRSRAPSIGPQPGSRILSQSSQASFSSSRPPNSIRPSDLSFTTLASSSGMSRGQTEPSLTSAPTPTSLSHHQSHQQTYPPLAAAQRSRPESGQSQFSYDISRRNSGIYNSALPLETSTNPLHTGLGLNHTQPPTHQSLQSSLSEPSLYSSPPPQPSGSAAAAFAQHHAAQAQLQQHLHLQSQTQSHSHAQPSQPGQVSQAQAQTPPQPPSRFAPPDTPVLFVAASLFEFNIDRARREAGYPYLTYVQGEVFDVVAQKGELWLAKNQDDSRGMLGWIWEQHFVILGRE